MSHSTVSHRKGHAVSRSGLLLASCFFLVLGFATSAEAVPVFGKTMSHLQPDGSRVTVRVWGDEFYRVVESLDGYTLVYDTVSKAGCYARLSADGNQLVSTGTWAREVAPPNLNLEKHLRIKPETKRSLIAEARAEHARQLLEALHAGPRGGLRAGPPNIGNVQAIVLLIDFSDEPGTIPPGSVDDYCNLVGYTGYGNNGSVRDYYYDVSDGALTYTNYVPSAYYRAVNPKTYYEDPLIDGAQQLILEALNDLDNQGFDFGQYDSNGDGFVDGINVYYAGFTNNAWSEGLWPHSSTISFAADGVSTWRYQITDMGVNLTLGTFCHENGHMINYWPDLYDYDFDSPGLGGWCLMAYQGPDRNPVEPCAYLKDDAGWTITTVLDTLASDIPAPSTSNTIYKYPHPSTSWEYYMIENRQQVERDAGLPDHGLAIWHIDETGQNSNNEMTEASHFKVTLVQADGDWDLENNNNYGDSTDLWAAPGFVECTPETNPNTNWWDGTSSDLYISRISASGTDMTFTFGPPEDCNDNGVPDFEDLASGTSPDCNGDERPDECGVIQDCELDKLPAPTPGIFFGWSVAMDGDVAVVGMSQESCPAGAGCGSADVYRFDGAHWVFEQNLTAPVREAADSFGWNVAVDGDLIVIGATGDKCESGGAAGCGSVFLFRDSAGSWTLEDSLQPSDALGGDSFGGFVAVDGDLVVAGAYLDDCTAGTNCGSAYVFRNNAGTWTEEEKLVAPDAAGSDWFGNSVAVEGDVIAIGADGDDCSDPEAGNCGGAYMFSYDGAAWNYDEKIIEASGFGFPVAINGDVLMVGAPFESCDLGSNCGGVYVYRFNGTTWDNREIRLTAPSPADGDFFGRSIAMSGRLVVIGASGVNCPAGSFCGRGFAFRNIASDWARDAELVASDASAITQLGMSAALSGNMVMMGSDGAAYAYSLGDADCDCNAVSDVCEINAGTANDANANGVIDDCENNEPLAAPYPHDRRKNRYISFDPNKEANDGEDVAFKVELLSINMGSCDDGTGAQGGNVDFCRTDRGTADCKACSGSADSCISAPIDCSPGESCDPTGAVCVNDLPNTAGANVGMVWWVGPEKNTATDPNLSIHLLVSEPFRKVSTDWPNPVHAGDCEVVPQAVFGIRAVETTGGAESNELAVSTTALNVCSASGDLCNVVADCPAGETCDPVGSPAPFWWGDVVGVLAFHCNGDIREQTCDPNTSNGDCTGSGTPASCCTGVGTGLCDCPGGDPCARAWELPNGVTNVDDVTAALWTSAPAPPTTVSAEFTWVDVHGNDSFTAGSQNFDPPNNKINASDLQQIISGFGGFPYKFYDPADCPDASDWP